MIEARVVYDAIEAHLKSVLRAYETMRALSAPDGTPDVYAVIERPDGKNLDGTHAEPEAHAWLPVRVRAVCRSSDITVAGDASEDLAFRLGRRLLDRSVPISGDGWAIKARRHESSGGTMTEGPVANTIDDYLLWIVPA